MNAKQELLRQVQGKGLVCAELRLGFVYALEDEDNPPQSFCLKQDYSETDLEVFLKSIDFNYDDGYGGQELHGFIWHTSNTWSERYEYDGSERWDFKEIPPIPEKLQSQSAQAVRELLQIILPGGPLG